MICGAMTISATIAGTTRKAARRMASASEARAAAGSSSRNCADSRGSNAVPSATPIMPSGSCATRSAKYSQEIAPTGRSDARMRSTIRLTCRAIAPAEATENCRHIARTGAANRGHLHAGMRPVRRSNRAIKAICNRPATSNAAASGIAFSTASHPLATGISKAPPTSRMLKITGIAAAVMKRPSAFAMAAQKATSEIMGR